MKRLLLVVLLVVALGTLSFATEVATVSSGATTVIVPGSPSALYSNSNFNGWDIILAFGNSNSPALSPFGIDLTALATCAGGSLACATTPLSVFVSDIGFNGAASYTTTYSATDSGSGSTIWYAWEGNTNTDFDTSNPIGVVGPFTGAGGFGTVSGGVPGVTPDSLTGEAIFTDTSGGSVSFSADGNITVPEPASIALFGSGLLGLAGFARRRFLK